MLSDFVENEIELPFLLIVWVICFHFNFFSFSLFPSLFIAIKKVTSIGTPPSNSCPVCGVHLLANELETHFLAELDRLYKLSSGPERQRIRASFNIASGMHMNNGLIQGPDNRWEVSRKIDFISFSLSIRNFGYITGFFTSNLVFSFFVLCLHVDIPTYSH